MTIDTMRLMRETFVARAEYRPTVDSTNSRAARCASQGAKDLPFVVVADEQTAGRGRGGNRWWTGPNSLAFSLLVDAQTVAADENRSPLAALATGVAVVDAVAPLLPGHEVGIHWPNDVYARPAQSCSEPHAPTDLSGDRKLAGILVEVLPDRRHVIGIGLNVNDATADAPPELRNVVATLRDLSGREHDRTAVLVALLQNLERQFSNLCDNPDAVAARADSLCLQRGRSLTLDANGRKIVGTCRGIAADGALEIETAAGIEKFISGSVIREAARR